MRRTLLICAGLLAGYAACRAAEARGARRQLATCLRGVESFEDFAAPHGGLHETGFGEAVARIRAKLAGRRWDEN